MQERPAGEVQAFLPNPQLGISTVRKQGSHYWTACWLGQTHPIPSPGMQSRWGWLLLGKRPWNHSLQKLREDSLLRHRKQQTSTMEKEKELTEMTLSRVKHTGILSVLPQSILSFPMQGRGLLEKQKFTTLEEIKTQTYTSQPNPSFINKNGELMVTRHLHETNDRKRPR